jgi:hypothetical protein
MSTSHDRHHKSQQDERQRRKPPRLRDRRAGIGICPSFAAKRAAKPAQRERQASGIGQQRRGYRQQRYDEDEPVL